MKNPLPWIGQPPPSDASDHTVDLFDSEEEVSRDPPTQANTAEERDELATRPVMTRDQIVARLRELLGSPEVESRLREVSPTVPDIITRLEAIIELTRLNDFKVIILIVDFGSEYELLYYHACVERLIETIAHDFSLLLEKQSSLDK